MESLARINYLLYFLLIFACLYSYLLRSTANMANTPFQPASRHLRRRLTFSTLPAEIIGLVSNAILRAGPGAERHAFALAATNHSMRDNTIQGIYEHTIRNDTFHLVSWAAANNRMDVLELALSYGADINEPIKSVDFFNGRKLNFCSGREQYAADSELDGLVYDRLEVFRRDRSRLDELWYRGDTYAVVPPATLRTLVKFYDEGTYQSSMDDPLLSIAHTPEGKRIFLGMFCFWTTPLHLAIAADHRGMIDELVQRGADVNATGYGNCDCNYSDEASSKNVLAYSCLHLLDCCGTLEKRHQALLRGPNLPTYLRADQSMLIRSLPGGGWELMRSINTAGQPHNILQEVLLSKPAMERSAWYLKALIGAGHGPMIRERDTSGRLPVEVAMEKGFDLEVVEVLLGGGEDLIVEARTDGSHGNEACSVLIWAILAGHLQYASYLLPGNPARPRNSYPRYSVDPAAVTESTFSALHAICARASEDVDMVAFQAEKDDAFPCNGGSTYRSTPENHRTALLQNALKTKAAQHINTFSDEERTPLSEALVWVAMEPFGEREENAFVLVQHGANPFAGIEMGLKSPIELFLQFILSAPTYSILSLRNDHDYDCMEKLLETLRGMRFRASQAQAAGLPKDVFNQLSNATDFLWAPRALHVLRSLRENAARRQQ